VTSPSAAEPADGLGTARSGSPLLAASGIRKTFAGAVALDGVDFDVAAGEVHALLGENGSGKSTLIKILSGYHEPDAGTVEIDGEQLSFGSPDSSYALGCRFIHQDLGLVGTMSVADNLLLNGQYPRRAGTVRDREAVRIAREELERVGLDVDPRLPIDALSPAQRTGVAVARALRRDAHNETKVLVFDEPTATLPDGEVQHLLATVRRVAAAGVGVIYVTHRLNEVSEIADRITVLRDGERVATRPARGMTRPEIINLLVGHEFDGVSEAAAALRPAGEPTLRVSGLSSGPMRGLSFDAYAGEVLGIAGVTGSGRETVLAAVFGAVPRAGGTVNLDGKVVVPDRPDLAVKAGIGYLPADRKVRGGIMQLTARENLTLADLSTVWRAPFLRRKRENAEAGEWFERLSVKPAGAIDSLLSSFSGGNQQKVLLAKWLRRAPKALLLDEPTQGVDVHSKAEIHRHLVAEAERGAAVVIASSDVEELVSACTRVLVIRDGRIVADLEDATVAHISREALGSNLVGSST
jgi:ribose transport system ATP-binding protein